jgi:KaiC/GvpD/RAD55 family RecA-like ATPase
MRLLIWHVDAFVAEPAERGRSRIADAEPRSVTIGEGLVIFAATERADEAEPLVVAGRAVEAVEDVSRRLGARTLVLHSFSHLFVELSSPEIARAIFDRMQALLEERHYMVSQTAFGWFHRLELRAKGHPLSRIARQI